MKAVHEFFAQPKIYQTAMGLDKPPNLEISRKIFVINVVVTL